jgi:hypothetical protein
VRAEAEEKNRKRRKIESEAIQVIALKARRNRGRRRRHTEERNPHQAQDRGREVQVEKNYIKSEPREPLNKNRARCLSTFFLLSYKLKKKIMNCV